NNIDLLPLPTRRSSDLSPADENRPMTSCQKLLRNEPLPACHSSGEPVFILSQKNPARPRSESRHSFWVYSSNSFTCVCWRGAGRSEEHTSELQSRVDLV